MLLASKSENMSRYTESYKYYAHEFLCVTVIVLQRYDYCCVVLQHLCARCKVTVMVLQLLCIRCTITQTVTVLQRLCARCTVFSSVSWVSQSSSLPYFSSCMSSIGSSLIRM